MEGNVLNCSIEYDPTLGEGQMVNGREKVMFISFGELLGIDSGKDLSLKLDYMIIQRLKDIERAKENITEIEDEKKNGERKPKDIFEKEDNLPDLEEGEKIVIEKHIEKYRPEKNWTEIAEILGIAIQTLRRKREKYNLT